MDGVDGVDGAAGVSVRAADEVGVFLVVLGVLKTSATWWRLCSGEGDDRGFLGGDDEG